MSKFEDYEKVSKVYDKERVASGADVIAGLLHVYGNRPLKVSDDNSRMNMVFFQSTVCLLCFSIVFYNVVTDIADHLFCKSEVRVRVLCI